MTDGDGLCPAQKKPTICYETANSCSAHNYWFSRGEKDETVTVTEKQDYFIFHQYRGLRLYCLSYHSCFLEHTVAIPRLFHE